MSDAALGCGVCVRAAMPVTTPARRNSGTPGLVGEQDALISGTLTDHARIPALTGIRGIAAIWVVALHFSISVSSIGIFPAPDDIYVTRSGYLGVDVFFILSGFVMALNYSASLRELSFASVSAFAVGRVFRILPLHWLTLAIFLIAVSVLPHAYWGPGPFSAKAFIASLFLVQSWVGFPICWNYAAWSLSAEWLAYVVFVLFVKYVLRVRRWSTLLISAFACAAGLVLILLMFHSVTLNHAEKLGLIRCIFEFACGALLCRLCFRVRISVEMADVIFVLGACLVAIGVSFRPLELVSVFGFGAVILACGASSRLSGLAFANRSSLWLGRVSYSSYLTHALLLNAGLALTRTPGASRLGVPGELAIMLAVLACVLPVSWAAWRFIEMPGQKLGKSLSRRAFDFGRKQHGYRPQRNR